MAFRDQASGEMLKGKYFDDFKAAIKNRFDGKPADYLVLLGDILDFSVTRYSEAYEVGKFFFQKLRDEDLAHEIIYIPGNHDFDIWNTVQYQLNITNRVIRGKSPKPFRRSVPVIFDDRKQRSFWKLTLPRVRMHKQKDMPKYAGLFLDYLTTPPTPFNFGFPNLYLITDDQTMIMTHGHYLDMYWSFLGRWCLKVFNSDLQLKKANMYDLAELVAMNLPICEIESSVVGQSGPLTDIIQKIQGEVIEHNFSSIEVYLQTLKKALFSGWKDMGGRFNRFLFALLLRRLRKNLKNVGVARYDQQFLTNPDVRQRFLDFYRSTLYEIEELRENDNIDIPQPSGMIFGHTHQPIPWGSVKAPEIRVPELPSGNKFKIYNTGGWLPKIDRNGNEFFYGAEVFFYDSKQGFSSTGIGHTG